jgi:voltage-gated potassium channel
MLQSPILEMKIMLTLKQRLVLALGGLILVLVGCAIEYTVVEGYTFSEALYTTVIAIVTVGYSQPERLSELGRHFTIGAIALGVGFLSFILGTILQILFKNRRIL